MKYFAPLAAVLASPALAHDGAHLHPHDGASWLAVAAALAVILAAGALRLATSKADR